MTSNRRSHTLSAAEIQTLDRQAIEGHKIPSLKLMENAGRASAEEILRYFRRTDRREVSIFCGMGNNGGDGFVIGRHLKMAGVVVHVFLVGELTALKPDARTNAKLLEHVDVKIVEVAAPAPIVKNAVKNSSVIVDAIFGVGLNRAIDQKVKEIIDFINSSGKRVVAVDVPSGLDATTGKILGACVKADMTVTFSLPKSGFYKNAGPKCTGRVKVVDIGIPRELLKDIVYAGHK